jgi:DNA invertase Pin-like site-specific DNA recombinase
MSKQITVIPAVEKRPEIKPERKRRVAAYARVSTDRDEQLGSYQTQIEHYTRLIKSEPSFIFAGVYADEGISGTATKGRKGFNEMIRDALEGRIDLIITKSVSRFARNTVDSLVTIRTLKENGCEVYFEKENIYTFDGKGELLITIMSSIAQEESRSISENVIWGARKRFADGKYTMHYAEFLGYRRGDGGSPAIEPKEAAVVRIIYCMFLEGVSPYFIAKILTDCGIPTPTGRGVWYYTVIRSILTNEKYIGDALLQKTFSSDFLTKKRRPNNGELPQYYVENGHPAIIDRRSFAAVRRAFEKPPAVPRERKPGIAGKIRCGLCGLSFCRTVRHKGTKGEKELWGCLNRLKGSKCRAAFLGAADAEALLTSAVETILRDSSLLRRALKGLRTARSVISARKREIEQIKRYLAFEPDSPMRERIPLLAEKNARAEQVNELIGNAPRMGDYELRENVLRLGLPSELLECVTVYPDGRTEIKTV